ncbi:hypothetical protein DC31_15290 [Microbacterium sp. CH12i]|uniref:OmpA family protein n=1 Tax=Microbacterium sp. CH12i TaxID=1479651 RepID=UPI00046177AC|nr:OmpA family protein [Microbacterium sp. CH12i]KDA05884.1 hypothetical protein DC31_15290 [Microbacterium sp. CH12i]
MLSRSLAILASVVLLAGCAATADPKPEADPAPTEELTSESIVGEVPVTFGSAAMTVQVHPIVRAGESLVLTLDVVVDDDSSDVLTSGPLDALMPLWSSSSDLSLSDWVGVRLFDLYSEEVIAPALDESGIAVISRTEASAGASTERVQLVYGDSFAQDFDLAIPGGGFVGEVPVMEADVPDVEGADFVDLGAVVSQPVVPMVSYSQDLASATRTDADAEKALIALSADFLFGYDSAELTDEARAAIQAAAEQIGDREAGTVQVIGHTDSDGEEAANQDLSERRAAAVAAVLGEFIDATEYPLVVSGRSASEPAAPNDTEAGRLQNRRVELLITTPKREEGAISDLEAGELPDTNGMVATGAMGVDVEGTRPWHISAEHAYNVKNHLVVELKIEALDGLVGAAGPDIFGGTATGPAGS